MCIKDIIYVHWKAPSPPWLMVNTNGSVVGTHAACGGLSQDHLGTFLGAFACNLGIDSVFFPRRFKGLYSIWSLLPKKGGVIFGWRVTLLVL